MCMYPGQKGVYWSCIQGVCNLDAPLTIGALLATPKASGYLVSLHFPYLFWPTALKNSISLKPKQARAGQGSPSIVPQLIPAPRCAFSCILPDAKQG